MDRALRNSSRDKCVGALSKNVVLLVEDNFQQHKKLRDKRCRKSMRMSRSGHTTTINEVNVRFFKKLATTTATTTLLCSYRLVAKLVRL
jgi:hypothetical protein